MRKVLFTCCFLALAIAFYYVCAPLRYINFKLWLCPYELTKLGDSRNYYQIISSIATTFAALLTVTLGAFYYFNKIDLEAKSKLKENAKNRITTILIHLEKIDEICQKIFSDNISSDEELKFIRSRITYHFDRVNELMEIDDKGLDWGNDETNPYYALYSLVDNSEKLTHNMSIVALAAPGEAEQYHARFNNTSMYLQTKYAHI